MQILVNVPQKSFFLCYVLATIAVKVIESMLRHKLETLPVDTPIFCNCLAQGGPEFPTVLTMITKLHAAGLFSVLTIATLTKAHFHLEYPEPRGNFVSANEPTFCGEYDRDLFVEDIRLFTL